jgi:hypothetical protein
MATAAMAITYPAGLPTRRCIARPSPQEQHTSGSGSLIERVPTRIYSVAKAVADCFSYGKRSGSMSLSKPCGKPSEAERRPTWTYG